MKLFRHRVLMICIAISSLVASGAQQTPLSDHSDPLARPIDEGVGSFIENYRRRVLAKPGLHLLNIDAVLANVGPGQFQLNNLEFAGQRYLARFFLAAQPTDLIWQRHFFGSYEASATLERAVDVFWYDLAPRTMIALEARLLAPEKRLELDVARVDAGIELFLTDMAAILIRSAEHLSQLQNANRAQCLAAAAMSATMYSLVCDAELSREDFPREKLLQWRAAALLLLRASTDRLPRGPERDAFETVERALSDTSAIRAMGAFDLLVSPATVVLTNVLSSTNDPELGLCAMLGLRSVNADVTNDCLRQYSRRLREQYHVLVQEHRSQPSESSIRRLALIGMALLDVVRRPIGNI